mmetsp:Transcript_810/g.979  ORF Transcript_810/g.979 Transcript_810/m.979 type:complete len:193 (-) Transcript_810:82-660(-)|eukprot:CAMPEP_0194154770 /NCGR_PEP_ID=MMETSP0152-20130528/61879_1 /TAXON_ID=1049557 /ORGANISM="Thalassiothrix antarctica, Strain L6-D1" /LENGTH=192 /DNA_ID=CAMNT_0038861099 /DNA_START=61 /DNA_END=639 /DNA_ORIENTATION=+
MSHSSTEVLSLLEAAIRANNISVVRDLVKEKGKVDVIRNNGCRSSPLHLASVNGQYEIVLILLEKYKWNPNIQDVNGRTPLHWATLHRYKRLMILLLQYGSNPNITEYNFGQTPLHWILKYHGSKNEDIITTLLQFGAESSILDNDCYTPISIARNYNQKVTVQWFIQWRLKKKNDDNNNKHTSKIQFLHCK